MNVKQLLSLAYITPDEIAEIETPIGTVGYALAGNVVITSQESPRADDGADVFIHQHDSAADARECYATMVSELQACVNGFAMTQFADALARTATVPQGWDSV